MTFETEIVPVGEYRVSTNRRVKLFTVTASCVALALYDPQNRVAGMLHVVLPGKRLVRRKNDRAAFFADTGVPLLIREMIQQGGESENLQATLVGGRALFGKGRETDIGLENAAAVAKQLEKAEIPLVRMDTGGGEGRRITFCVDTGDVQVAPIPEKKGAFPIPLKREVHAGTGNGPEDCLNAQPNPTLSRMLLEAIHQPRIDWEGVQWIIARDPVLAMHFFKIANSPYYGRPGEISFFQRALNRLGAKQVRRICVIMATKGKSQVSPDFFALSQTGLSRHALCTAFISRDLSSRLPFSFPEEAFAAGLFHGMARLLEMFSISRHDKAPVSPRVAGRECRGMIREIFSAWHLPVHMVSAVLDDAGAHEKSDSRPSLSDLVHAGCGVSRVLGMTTTLETGFFNFNSKVLARLGVRPDLSNIVPGAILRMKEQGIAEYLYFDEMPESTGGTDHNETIDSAGG